MLTTKKVGAWLAGGIISASATFLIALPALSINDTTPFELDGNVTDAGGGGDDWSTANYGGIGGTQLAKTGVLADPRPTSIFVGGGSKDDLDVSQWKFKDGSVPDKDDITNAYAVAYKVNTDLVIYAGADRFDNSGDAFMGFWFFQNPITLGTGGGGGGTPFVGQHAVGDILVLANFTNGGTTATVEVLRWVGTGGNVNGTLQRIAGGPGGIPATCSSAMGDPDFCAITNTTGGETPPWPYLSKSGTSFFPPATFMEMGINISKVFAGAGLGNAPCFSAFMAETRSSSSVSAQLKDFALGSFPVCGVAVSKVCKDPVLVGDTTIGYTIEGRVENTGFGTLTNVALVDNPAAASAFERYACNGNVPTGPAVGVFPTSLAPLASACYRATFLSATNGPGDAVTVTATAGAGTVTAQAATTCPKLSLSPALDVTKACTTALEASGNNTLVVRVDVTGNVCNTGDAKLTNVTVTDTDIPGNLLVSPQVLPVGQCKGYTGSYYPSVAENLLAPGSSTTEPGLAKFSDTVTAKADSILGFQVTPDTATAHCNLCPGGVCASPVTGTQTNLFRRQR
jgi:hypothetical protein